MAAQQASQTRRASVGRDRQRQIATPQHGRKMDVAVFRTVLDIDQNVEGTAALAQRDLFDIFQPGGNHQMRSGQFGVVGQAIDQVPAGCSSKRRPRVVRKDSQMPGTAVPRSLDLAGGGGASAHDHNGQACCIKLDREHVRPTRRYGVPAPVWRPVVWRGEAHKNCYGQIGAMGTASWLISYIQERLEPRACGLCG